MPKPQRQKLQAQTGQIERSCKALVQEVKKIKIDRNIRNISGNMNSSHDCVQPMECSSPSANSTKRPTSDKSAQNLQTKRQRIQWP